MGDSKPLTSTTRYLLFKNSLTIKARLKPSLPMGPIEKPPAAGPGVRGGAEELEL